MVIFTVFPLPHVSINFTFWFLLPLDYDEHCCDLREIAESNNSVFSVLMKPPKYFATEAFYSSYQRCTQGF